MATGDIIAATIDSTGCFADITVEGWASSAGNITYDYGDVTNRAGYVKFTVVSEGYDIGGTLGTITRTVYAYSTLRKEKPNDASKYETVSGSDLIIRVALESNVYDDDKNGGAGTSGTDPTLTVTAALWAVSSSPSRTNNAVSGLTVTNSSTLDYPVAFGQWDPVAGALHRSRVQSSFTLAFNARHGPGVACVRFNCVGGTSSVDTESFATVQTATMRTGTSLYACAYHATISLTPYTQGETLTSRARVYPLVGDANAVFDTSGRTTADDECLGGNEHVLICDKSAALGVAYYVSTTGNDTTGTGTSGNPWLTINKAIKTSGANIVYLMGTGTTYDLTFSGARRTSSEWCIVQPDSGATPTVRMISTSVSTRKYAHERLMLYNLPVTKQDNNSYMNGDDADNFLAFVSCVFDDGGFGSGSNPGPGYGSNACYILNCTGDLNRTQWCPSGFSTARNAYIFDGIPFIADSNTSNNLNGWYRVVACTGTDTIFADKTSTNPAPTMARILFEFNSFPNCTHSSANILLLQTAITGVSIIGNVIEKTAGSNAMVHLWADGTGAACSHVIVAHNTWVGSTSGRRCNLFYNDLGTTAYNHTHVFLLGNHIDEGNIKSDTFALTAVGITRSGTTATITVNAADASNKYTAGQSIYVSGANQSDYNGTFTIGTSSGSSSGGTLTYTVSGSPATPATGTISLFGLGRTGNWPQLFGINWRANNMDTTSGFAWENLGVDNSAATPSFVNAGSDDYTPSAGDGLLSRVSNPYVPKDLYGRKFAGSAAIGARQIVTPDVIYVVGGGTSGMIG